MSETEALCSCECVSHGELGPVTDQEHLARVVVHPTHFRKDGSIKPGLFPLKHIRESGLSLMRADKMDEAESTKQAMAVCSEGKKVSGVRLCRTGDLRAIVGQGGRSLCVKDDPVKNHEGLPDNPAHAVSIRSQNQDDPEVLRIQGELTDLFGELVPIESASVE